MTHAGILNKSTKLSKEVQRKLFLKGYSFAFNDSDFHYFEKITKKEFNQVNSIVKLFIETSEQPNDFNDYIF